MRAIFKKHQHATKAATKRVRIDGRGRGANHAQTQTVYVKLSLDVVDYVYFLHPDLTIAGGVERILSDLAKQYANGAQPTG